MPLSITVNPSAEPIDLEEVKEHLRIFGSQQDALIQRHIVAARVWCETFTNRAFINQTCVLTLHGFSVGPICLPRPPLSSVTSVQYVDENGNTQTWSSSLYTVVQPSGDYALHGEIRPAHGETYPATRDHVETVTITYVAGYGAASTAVPQGIKHGILERVDDLFRNRDAVGSWAERMLGPYYAPHRNLRFE